MNWDRNQSFLLAIFITFVSFLNTQYLLAIDNNGMLNQNNLALLPTNRIELLHPGQLTICSYNAFEPVIYGNGQGYEADIIRAVAKRMKLKTVFISIAEFEGIWKKPLEVRPSCDLVSGGLSITESRIKDGVVFSHPHYNIEQSLLVRKDE